MAHISKLGQLARIEGLSVDDMLEAAVFDSVSPGICSTPDCDYTTEVEPDSSEGWCEECQAGTVHSALILAGII